MKLRYVGEKNSYAVSFSRLSPNIVQITGDFPVKEKGFVLFREDVEEDTWDYARFTTIYRKIEDGVQFSNDQSVYTEPVKPEPAPEPEPYTPALEETKEAKVAEMNMAQQSVIQAGINVTLTDGTVNHFTLTDHDQTSLMGLQMKVAQGMENIPWHTSDEKEPCKYYSNADMALITDQAMEFVTFHVTYFRDLRIYIRSLTSKEEVEAVSYGIIIPEEYQSQPLKDMYAVMQEG